MPVAAVKTKTFSGSRSGTQNKSFAESLSDAVEYLAARVRNCNAVAASRTIEKFIEEQGKYRLFQKYFPAQWQNSRTSLRKNGFYENYSERTNEFFELVHQELFPLLAGWNEDPETEFDNFNVYSLNVDFCCDDIEYEYLRVSYVAALLFFSRDEEIWEYFSENYHVGREDFPPIFDRSHAGLWNSEETGRTEVYRNIFEVIDHSTGNPWFDTMNCQYNTTYSWDEETIESLTKSYREAQEILEKTAQLDSLIEANPKQVLREMISFWNTGRVSKAHKRLRLLQSQRKTFFATDSHRLKKIKERC